MLHSLCLLLGLSPFALITIVVWLIGGQSIDVALFWGIAAAVAACVAYFAICLGSAMLHWVMPDPLLEWWEERRP